MPEIPEFKIPGAPPTDPRFLEFLRGLKYFAEEPFERGTNRWHPRDGEWYLYDPKSWVIEDLGLPDTAPESALQQNFMKPWEVRESSVPDLFERLEKAKASYASRVPLAKNLVWSPLGGGDWRNAFKRTSQPPPTNPGPHPPLPEPCVKRVDEVNEWRRRGLITEDQAQRLIEAIVAECT